MAHVTRFWAENFKSIGPRCEVPVSRLTLLIGPNNAGKSNLLMALEGLRDFVVANPNRMVERCSVEGWHHLDRDRLIIGIEIATASGPGLYEIAIGRDRSWAESYQAKDGVLHADSTRIRWGSSVVASENRSAIHVLKRHNVTGSFLEIPPVLEAFTVARPDPENIGKPAQVQATTRLGKGGEGAGPMLDYLRDRYPERFEALQADLRSCAPEISSVVPAATSAPGVKQVLFFETNGAKTPAIHASEGLRILLYFLLHVHSPDPPRLMALEEIERGVHPRRIKDLLSFIRRLAESKDGPQILITTHSPLVLDEFRDSPEEVVVIERAAAGPTTCTPLSERLAHASPEAQEIALGDLWYSGVLGGVPAP